MNNYRGIFFQVLGALTITSMLLAGLLPFSPPAETVAAAENAQYIKVAPSGSDTASCGSDSAPCKTIQYAVNKSASGDVIQVAGGTYTYNSSADTCTFLITRAAVCLIDKHLSILGGYSVGNWSAQDPQANPTIIDGGNTRRGVAIIAYNTTASLFMDGFTIQNGLAQGASSGDDFYTFGFGGGMWAQNSSVTLRRMVFRNNRAVGGNTSLQYGGSGGGGGLAIQSSKNNAISDLEDVVFDGNQALGGSGSRRGGLAIGGGLFTYQATLTGKRVTFVNNVAQAGSSSGSGLDSIIGLRADALGGGAGFQIGSNTSLTDVVASNNRASGGNAGSSSSAVGGGGFGGGICAEKSSLSLTNAQIHANTATGGSSGVGGFAFGGGIITDGVNAVLSGLSVIDNHAVSGGSVTGGNAGSVAGGGGYFTSFAGTANTVQVINAIFAGNHLQLGAGSSVGGGGAGAVVQAIHADIIHTTFANNVFDSYLKVGQALVVHGMYGDSGIPASANLRYSIIANHTNPFTDMTSALTVASGSSIDITKVLFSGNTNDTNLNGKPYPVGSITGMNSAIYSSSVGFISPGAPTHDYHLALNSTAIDQAAGSSTQTDIDGQSRPTSSYPDLGADEFSMPAMYVSPTRIEVMLDRSTDLSRSVEVLIPANPAAIWTASSSVNWLALGSNNEQQTSGTSGDSLVIHFLPTSRSGTYTTYITVNSPDVAQTQIEVTMNQVSDVRYTYLPLARR